MKRFFSFLVLFICFVAAPASSFALDEYFFLEYDRYAVQNEASWHAVVGCNFDLYTVKGATIGFQGRINTVSEASMPFGGAGLTDIAYRLEPRVAYGRYFLSFNHWSLHKADVFGDVPNLNALTVGTERKIGPVTLTIAGQYMLTSSDAAYNKHVMIDARYTIARVRYGELYARSTAEVLPGAMVRAETGLRMLRAEGKIIKSTDLFVSWNSWNGLRPTSQLGLADGGFLYGFRLNF